MPINSPTFDKTNTHRLAVITTLGEVQSDDMRDTADALLCARNGIAGIHIRSFVTRESCAALLQGIRGIARRPKDTGGIHSDHQSYGVSQGSHAHDPAAYFTEVSAWNEDQAFRGITKSDGPIMRKVFGLFQDLFQRPVHVATQEGRALWPCVIRSIDNTQPHVDDVRSNTAWRISELMSQFAWNIYLSIGDAGGGTVIYNADADAARRAGNRLDQFDRCLLEPAPGDLAIFWSHLVHEVQPSTPSGQRITLNGMFALEASSDPAKILCWG